MAEQLIILGNGFDLRRDLKSSYADFYRDRYESQLYKDKIGYLKSVNGEKFENLDFDLNIWDIILCEIEEVRNAYWKDIEEVIRKYVIMSDPEIVEAINVGLNNGGRDQILERFDFRARERIFIEAPNGDLHSSDKEDFFELFDENFSFSNFFDFLMTELKKFEKEFAKYLFNQCSGKYSEYYAIMSTIILSKIIEFDTDNKIFDTKVISFNYTSPFNANNSIYQLKDESQIEIQKIQNVHGRLPHDIVFGIDRNAENETLPPQALPFTKTYRSLSVGQSNHQIKLFSKDTKIIKFYGHSLGEMDYTYFKVIFDSVDLVNGIVQLIFFFSLYNKHKDKENTEAEDNEIREENYKRIDNLIRRYEDETMSKDSDVLLHKLRLEGRLLLLEEGSYW
ncbi:hypothetical protein Hs30E_08290 [Lactococcus hodotermopsidis]|uniref:Bacteriophage abortive infection AbiH n=1 Tax=Pseudolactococcus hodotermopsidis TaxID=2709157 RepID=A0A6A0BD53_9LACT|nr:AbiH family protein [Lactococcus hodotermopsidis]GFH42278.1 hypothetical protein Hs30E_08290 [Lactococcus hodotermopsidis]